MKTGISTGLKMEMYLIVIQKRPRMRWIICLMWNWTICVPADIRSMKSWNIPMTSVCRDTKNCYAI